MLIDNLEASCDPLGLTSRRKVVTVQGQPFMEHHVFVHLDNVAVVAFISHQIGFRSCSLYRILLTQGSSRPGQAEPKSGHVVPGQCVSRRMETTSPSGSDNMVCLWKGKGGPFHVRRQLSLPNLFIEGARCSDPLLAHCSSACLSTIGPLPLIIRQVKKIGCSVLLMAPLWRNQMWFPEVDSAAVGSPLAN